MCRFIENGGAEVAAQEEAIAKKTAERDELVREGAEVAAQVRDLLTEKEIRAGGEMKELSSKVDELQLK